MTWIIRSLAAFAALYAAVCGYVYFNQESLVFNLNSAVWEGDYDWPEGTELDWFSTSEDVRLRRVFVPHTAQERLGAIVYYKGNAGNISDIPWLTEVFRDMGYDIYAFDYRGFGESVGPMAEQPMLQDATAFYDLVQSERPDEGLRIVGYSLGTTFASHVTRERAAGNTLLFAPMKSVLDLAQRFYPVLPSSLSRYPLRSDLKLKGTENSKILIFHGTADRIVPFASGKALADFAFDEDDTFIPIEGADHGSIIHDDRVHAEIKERWGRD